MSCNRRQILKASTLSFGSFAFGSSLAFAGTDIELEHRIRSIVQSHFPEAAQDQAKVDSFVRNMIAQKVPALEPRNFLKNEMHKIDPSVLERYVLIQFAIQ